MGAEPAEMAAARALYDAGRLPEAQQAFERLLAADPASADAHYYLGRLALERKDASGAVRELERAVALAPDSARIHNALGDAYGRSAENAAIFSRFGLARKCLAEYRRAVALEPGNVMFHERLFEYYSRAPSFLGGGDDKASDEAAAMERLDPIRGRQAYAALYMAGGKYDLALGELAEILRTAPDDYGSLYQVGHLVDLSGQHLDRGLDSLRHCLRLAAPQGAPSHSAAQWRLGNILRKMGDPAGARVAYEAALKLDPKFTPASDALRVLGNGPGGG
jgi:tetratricopeptide (TPR) repeat protein